MFHSICVYFKQKKVCRAVACSAWLDFDKTSSLNFFSILHTCLIYFKNLNFFLKDRFYLINWSASKIISDKGEGGVSQFLIFSDNALSEKI